MTSTMPKKVPGRTSGAPAEKRYAGSHMARSGMVAAAHPLAVVCGLEALREGGNAMDACLVMAGVTSVTIPQMCGLGGDAFFIYYDASTETIAALNGSGVPGDASTPDSFKDAGSILPQDGIFSVGVPGAPLVYELAARRFGTFDLYRCFDPAVTIAKDGFAVTPGFASAIGAEQAKIARFEEASKVFLPAGSPPKPGTVMKRPDMAETLRGFAERGAEYMYKGPFADRFYRMNAELGGTFTGREFARQLDEPSSYYDPIRTDYRGYTVLQTGPVSQGFIVLEELNILEGFEMDALNPLGAESIHLMVEVKKIAFADRNARAGDPLVTGFDASKYTSKEYAAEVRKRINLARASGRNDGVGDDRGDTTSFVAWDRFGNACSFIHSNAFSFGSGLMVPGTGVLLNNRVGRSFVLEPGHPNCLAPGKRPMHTLNCYMVLKDGAPFIAGGTPGGDGQPQWNMQVLSLMLDHGMGPQEAADFPRWTSTPGTDVIGLGRPFQVAVESRFPAATADRLARLGHSVKTVGEWAGGGGAQIIMRDPETGILLGGSDRRAAGLALGY
jgi:gamma-glutamyltranspeptidase/glutathione hydrolase